MSTIKRLCLTPLDTLFFRESRPFDTIGGTELISVFPPSPRTVLGALRTAIGDALGADWNQFRDNVDYALPDGRKLREMIGYADNLGNLSLDGLCLSLNGERLYPLPLFLMHREEKGQNLLARLRIGTAMETHIGRVYLPEIPERAKGYRSIKGAWLTRSGLEKILMGSLPGIKELHTEQTLLSREPRLGIARDNSTRTVENSLLYQTCHIRPKSGLAIEVDISGLNGVEIENRIVRLGGEGRIAAISSLGLPKPPAKPEVNKTATQGLILILLSPARFKNEEGNWLPEGFKLKELKGVHVWQGVIEGIALTLHAAVLGKAQREGGWNMLKRKPRDVQSLIPSGSSYYCAVDDGNIAKAIDVLQGKYIGEDRKFGRGVIACGLWNSNEFPTDYLGGKV